MEQKAPITSPNPIDPPTKSQLDEIGSLLNQTWDTYRQKLFSCITVQLIPIVPGIILGIIITILVLALVPTIQSTSGLLNTVLIIVAIIVGLLTILGIIFLALWLQAALLVAITDPENNNKPLNIYQKAIKYIFPLLWIGLITALVSFPGYLFLIIPGVVITVWLQLATWIMIDQNIHGFDALVKSKALIAGRWWDIFARFLIIGIIVYLLNIVVGMIVMPITFLSAAFNLEFIANIIQWLISIFITPFSLIYTYLIYKNLIAIKPDHTLPQLSKTWMIIFAIISIVIIIGILLVAFGLGAFGALMSSNIF